MINRFFSVIALAMTLTMSSQVTAQVQTEVRPVVPGAQPVTPQHIKVHASAWKAIWREILLIVTCSYICRPVTTERSRDVTQLCTRCMVTQSARSNGSAKYTCLRRSKAHSQEALKK